MRLAFRKIRVIRSATDIGRLLLSAAEAVRLFAPAASAAEAATAEAAAAEIELLASPLRPSKPGTGEVIMSILLPALGVGGKGGATKEMLSREVSLIVERKKEEEEEEKKKEGNDSLLPSSTLVPVTLKVTCRTPRCGDSRRGGMHAEIYLQGWSAALAAAGSRSLGERVMLERFEPVFPLSSSASAAEKSKKNQNKENKDERGNDGDDEEKEEEQPQQNFTVVVSSVGPGPIAFPSRREACLAWKRGERERLHRRKESKRLCDQRRQRGGGGGAKGKKEEEEDEEEQQRKKQKGEETAPPAPAPPPPPPVAPRPPRPPRPTPPPPPLSAVVPICPPFDLEALQLTGPAGAIFDAARDGALRDPARVETFCFFEQQVEVEAATATDASSSSFSVVVDRVPNADYGRDEPAAFLTLSGQGWVALAQRLRLEPGLGVLFQRGSGGDGSGGDGDGFVRASRVAR